MHPRKKIRDAFKAALDQKTSAGRNVFASRLAPITLDTLPALMVYVRDETIAPDDYPASGEGSVKRRLEITVECVVKGKKTVDDDLDALCEEVEAVFEFFPIPGFGAAEPRLIETELDVSDAFQEPVGSASLTFEVEYRTPYRVQVDPPHPVDVFAEIDHSGVRELVVDGPGGPYVEEAAP